MRSATADRLLNAVLYYSGWFACAALAGAGRAEAAGLGAALTLLHVRFAERRADEAALAAAAGVFGLVSESALAYAGIIAYPHGRPFAWLCAPWIVFFWTLFATTLRYSMAWLLGRGRLAALLGFFAGPLAFRAGAALGAIELARGWTSLAVLAVVWAGALPLLVHLAGRRARSPGAGRYRFGARNARPTLAA